MSGFQPDLFGETDAIEDAARNFLATPWTSLLGWWGHPDVIEAMVDHGEIKASKGEGYAYSIRPKGLHFEPVETWGGWSSRPRHMIPWASLRAWRETHPGVTAQIEALSAGRGHPRRLGWRWWMEPFALRGRGWHPSYLEHEQEPDYYDGDERPDTAWADRMTAWHLVIDATADAELVVETMR